MDGEANSMVSVYSTFRRWTATSNFINAVKRQRNLGLTSNLTTVVNSVLKFMISGTTSILKSYIFQTCAAIYQLLLHMVFTSRNWFAMQGIVAIILISWNVIFIWETGYWTRAIKRFALFDLLKSLYSDTKDLVEIYSVSAENIISDAFSYSENV